MTTIPRRLLLAAASLPLFLRGGRALAAIDANSAAAFIQATGNEMVRAINTARDPNQRRQQVAAILRRAVDIEGVGRFILGRWWRVATPAEQQEYMRLFEETLIRNLSARFGVLRAPAVEAVPLSRADERRGRARSGR